jgi:hypothetical protein
MILYLSIFFIITLLYFNTINHGGLKTRGLIIVMALLALFVGFGDMLGGYDRYIYGELFDDVAETRFYGRNILLCGIFEQYPKELGYDWYNVLISFVTANRYIFILITTLIIYTLIFVSIRRYTENNAFALILFMGLMFFFTFTYLRQVLGVGIAWLSIKYVYERKLWKFLGIMAIATLFHNSAIMLVPLYFIPIKKFDINSVIFLMVVCLILGLTGLPSTLFQAYGSVSEMEERAAQLVGDTNGFRIEYLLEAVFFLIIILNNYNKIPNDKLNIVLLNMSLIFCAILLFFIKSENGGRLSWYYLIGILCTMTYLSTNNMRDSKLAIFMMFVSLFLYVRIYVSWQHYLNLYPYKTFFTNGYRDGDYSWENYEYDHNYDIKKLYK